MMPEVTFDGSQHKDKLDPILPDAWPILQDGPIRCVPWVAVVLVATDANDAETSARELAKVINRGSRKWRHYKIDWKRGEREAILKKLDQPINVL